MPADYPEGQSARICAICGQKCLSLEFSGVPFSRHRAARWGDIRFAESHRPCGSGTTPLAKSLRLKGTPRNSGLRGEAAPWDCGSLLPLYAASLLAVANRTRPQTYKPRHLQNTPPRLVPVALPDSTHALCLPPPAGWLRKAAAGSEHYPQVAEKKRGNTGVP